ncbi:hypothetical protein MCUN1_001806 [Malassezia cuniculi]|uniref:Uncharacterized protein n=1 Tax=Malassezia cuniculi TaxID=948313 RepID=A0AAF0ER66_9BASI|nr:hypothetical protein MCUN1_001806 [Malassezia cuniculi]
MCAVVLCADEIVDRDSFRAVVRGVVHTVAFFRMLGSLRPATQVVLGVELPRISDEHAAGEIDERCDSLADELEQKQAGRATLRISWLPPPAGRGEDTKSIFHSPYAWIASAFSGGFGDKLGEKRDALPEFEHWIIHIRIGSTNGGSQLRDFYGKWGFLYQQH